MKHADIIHLPVLIRDYLLKYSDSDHAVSTPELKAYLSDFGFDADRRSIYKAISTLKEHGCPVNYVNRKSVQGYWIEHTFTAEEAFFLSDAIQSSASLSQKSADEFSAKVKGTLSEYELRSLPEISPAASRSDNDQILNVIAVLLKAIHNRNPVEFRYYDLSVTRKKQYRRSNKIYHLIPYALVSNANRYYCVFYSKEHESFANYRIDKMDMIHVLEEQEDPVFFSLKDHIRSSFNMYHGEPDTVTVSFDLSLANVVFDEFGRDIIISKVDETSFTASIRTSVTPTLISWLLQFYDRMEVKKPESLKERLYTIGENLIQTYQKTGG